MNSFKDLTNMKNTLESRTHPHLTDTCRWHVCMTWLKHAKIEKNKNFVDENTLQISNIATWTLTPA